MPQDLSNFISKPLTGALAAFVTVLSWASAFVLIRRCLQEVGPISLASVRFAVVGTIFILMLTVRKSGFPDRSDLPRIAACGLIGILGYNILLNTGEVAVDAGTASLLVNTVPIQTALVGALFGQRLNATGWIGSLVSFVGVAVVAGDMNGGIRLHSGAALVICAATAQAVYFVLLRPLTERYGAFRAAGYVLIAGALFLACWLPSFFADASAGRLSSATRLAIVVLGVLPGVIGYTCWNVAIREMGAPRASQFLFLVPPTTILLSSAWLRETPTWSMLAGGMIAICGVAIANVRRSRTPKAALK